MASAEPHPREGSAGVLLDLPGEGLRLPPSLLGVLVREGDLAASAVPVAAAAEAVTAALQAGGPPEAAVEALSALCAVWERRVAEAAGQAFADWLEPPAPVVGDPDLRRAARRLGALGEAADRQRGRPRRPLEGPRLGRPEDLWRARQAMARRQEQRVKASVLWPEPTRLPVLRRMRQLLGALRRRPVLTLFRTARSPEERVAELLATLELCRRGRAHVRQRVPYGPVRLVRRRR